MVVVLEEDGGEEWSRGMISLLGRICKGECWRDVGGEERVEFVRTKERRRMIDGKELKHERRILVVNLGVKRG